MSEKAAKSVLLAIVEDLLSVYDDQRAIIWLGAPQFPSYGRGGVSTRDRSLSAFYLIESGRGEEVRQRVDQLASGSYA